MNTPVALGVVTVTSGWALIAVNWWLLRKLRRDRQQLQQLGRAVSAADLADGNALIRLEWVADIPVAHLVAGDPLQAAIWLHQANDGVSIHA